MKFVALQQTETYQIDHITTNLMLNRKGQITSYHYHPVYHLMYITEGEGRFRINDRWSNARPGLLYFISPNEGHLFSGDEQQGLCNLECTFQLCKPDEQLATIAFDRLLGMTDVNSAQKFRSPVQIPAQYQPILVEGFQRIIEAPSSFYSKEHLHILVADLLARVQTILLQSVAGEATSEQLGDERMEHVKQYLEANLSTTVTLSQVAAFAYLTPNYLCRVFKSYTGQSPMDYLHGKRIDEAKKLLTLTDLPIYMIAEKVGFEDPSYFARAFGKKTGVAPQKYRNQIFHVNE